MQDKTSEIVDLAWLAGFLDGEGSFTICKVSGRYPQPAISFRNTHYPTLPEVTALLDRVGLPYYVAHVKPVRITWKPQWAIQAVGLKRCAKWCEVLLPYLKTKRADATAMAEYASLRLARPPQDAWGGREMTTREQELVGLLNRGIRNMPYTYTKQTPRSKSPQTTRSAATLVADGIVGLPAETR